MAMPSRRPLKRTRRRWFDAPAIVWMLLCVLAAAPLVHAKPKDVALTAAKKEWTQATPSRRVVLVKSLGAQLGSARLEQFARWLREPNALLQAELLDAIVGHALDVKLRPRVEQIMTKFLAAHLKARQKREDKEFAQVCRKHGRRYAEGKMAAGSDWTDPYDEKKRTLPDDIKNERLFMKRALFAIEKAAMPSLRRTILDIFHQHHDPDVLVACLATMGRLKVWGALPDMADLLRPLEYGREMQGAPTMGARSYDTMRLKWDVHKDRLWWSRPEYVLRTRHPIFDAFRAITGQDLRSSSLIDKWLLNNEETLRKNGVKLTSAFRARTRRSQR